LQQFDEFGLVEELRVLGAGGLQLDSDLIVGLNVCSQVDFTKGPAADFAPKPVPPTYTYFNHIYECRLIRIIHSAVLLRLFPLDFTAMTEENEALDESTKG
jgi:hypothetical protein